HPTVASGKIVAEHTAVMMVPHIAATAAGRLPRIIARPRRHADRAHAALDKPSRRQQVLPDGAGLPRWGELNKMTLLRSRQLFSVEVSTMVLSEIFQPFVEEKPVCVM